MTFCCDKFKKLIDYQPIEIYKDGRVENAWYAEVSCGDSSDFSDLRFVYCPYCKTELSVKDEEKPDKITCELFAPKEQQQENENKETNSNGKL